MFASTAWGAAPFAAADQPDVQLPNRMKPLARLITALDMAPVGQGTIDWKRIFAKRDQGGIRHYFVEHDQPAEGPGGAFASITTSYNYLRDLTV